MEVAGTTYAARMSGIFGVKVWRSWTVDGYDSPGALEEAVLLIRAGSPEEAADAALAKSRAAESEHQNSDGATVRIRTLGVDWVFDAHASRAVSGLEVFARLYEVDDDEPPPFGPPPEVWPA